MPGFLLQQGATAACQHGGVAQPATVGPRVRADGRPVVTQADLFTVAGCPFAPGGASSPCVTASWINAAARVKAGGVPVILQDSRAVCAPNGTSVNIIATQLRVRGQ